jgi:hypothetical protein
VRDEVVRTALAKLQGADAVERAIVAEAGHAAAEARAATAVGAVADAEETIAHDRAALAAAHARNGELERNLADALEDAATQRSLAEQRARQLAELADNLTTAEDRQRTLEDKLADALQDAAAARAQVSGLERAARARDGEVEHGRHETRQLNHLTAPLGAQAQGDGGERRVPRHDLCQRPAAAAEGRRDRGRPSVVRLAPRVRLLDHTVQGEDGAAHRPHQGASRHPRHRCRL